MIYLLLSSTSLLWRCAQEETSDKIMVGVSIQPLADLTQKIGGSKVSVFTIIPTGANPHTFELTPGIMKKMNSADLLVFNGIGLEYWLNNVLEALSGKKAVFTSEGLTILQEHHDQHAEGNPHVWLNPQNAIHQAKRIYAALTDVDPTNRAYYETQTAVLIKELTILDSDIENQVNSWKQKRFVCFHPSWVYFAQRYGLEQAGVIEKTPGQEARPKDIAELVETIKKIGARAVFAELQFPARSVEIIAQESNIQVITLDPLGALPQTKSYVDLMRYNVALMNRVMRE
ncbi:MAG: zinc ABC transporter substrate-binding protein [Calditrichaeota bacterium]|nr:MAG: zinc ABC transporter substrate-binding protein [Calditrichota bacterium]